MAYYNLTNVTSQNNIADMSIELIKLSGGSIFGIGIMILILALSYVGLKGQYDSQVSLLAASFFAMIAGAVMAFSRLQWVSQEVWWGTAVVLLLAYIAVNRFGKA